ncbi:hypothetical protein TNCV_4429081 [Trichonephila clavipes]|nr:hypothetical protein TNCV_4429081 [Trichonephila clavipes]
MKRLPNPDLDRPQSRNRRHPFLDRDSQDGPRHFEPWTSDVDDTLLAHPSPNYHTSLIGERLSLDIFNVNQPAWRVFNGTRLELVTCLPRVRYLDHLATTAMTGIQIYEVRRQ